MSTLEMALGSDLPLGNMNYALGICLLRKLNGRFFLLATICCTFVVGARGQEASAVAAGGEAGSPVVALILQLARGARDALRLFQRLLKALSRLYEAVSPELEAMRCMRKALFTRVVPPYLRPPWPTEGWTHLPRRRRSLTPFKPLPQQRPFLIINDPLAPASPPKLIDVLENYLSDIFGDPTIIEAWRDFKSSWFGVVSGRSTKCARTYVGKRFWRWVNAAPN